MISISFSLFLFNYYILFLSLVFGYVFMTFEYLVFLLLFDLYDWIWWLYLLALGCLWLWSFKLNYFDDIWLEVCTFIWLWSFKLNYSCVCHLCMVFTYIWSIHVSCFLIWLIFFPWMLYGCIWILQIWYALWLFVDAKGGEK